MDTLVLGLISAVIGSTLTLIIAQYVAAWNDFHSMRITVLALQTAASAIIIHDAGTSDQPDSPPAERVLLLFPLEPAANLLFSARHIPMSEDTRTVLLRYWTKGYELNALISLLESSHFEKRDWHIDPKITARDFVYKQLTLPGKDYLPGILSDLQRSLDREFHRNRFNFWIGT